MLRPATEHLGMETFAIPAMDCPEELGLIEKGLKHHAGILSFEPIYLERRLQISFDPRETTPPRIAEAISQLGFPAQIASDEKPADRPSGRPLRWWTTLIGGVLLAVAAVIAIAAQFLGPYLAINVAHATLAAQVLCVLSTLVAGAPVAKAGWRALRLRSADMNLLMTVAAVGALGIGEFFEAATAMFLFGVSLLLEGFSLDRTRRAVHGLAALAPTVAHHIHGDHLHDINPAALKVNDLVLVKPGERIPVDGVVTEGISSVNEAPVTGESVPVEKEASAKVYGGSLNGEGSLTIRTVHTAGESTVARIARLVVDAQASRAPTARFVDEFARRYTPGVIGLAALLAIVPPLLSYLGLELVTGVAPSEWFRRALVLLVIACPCALVISTPVTIVCGLYRAARRGLLVKGGEHLENAALVDCVAIDKTGTLTTGRAEVVRIDAAPGATSDEVLRVAASLEQSSEHPLAAAIVRAARQGGISLQQPSEFTARRGFGVEGRLGGELWFVGSPRMMAAWLPNVADTLDSRQDDATAVCIGTKDRWQGTVYLTDPPRPDAAESIAAMRDAGVKRVVVLTGDRRSVAERIGKLVGADGVEAELLPDDKVARVAKLAEKYPYLAMVGDGVNDAPALAASRLGIALGSGASDLAIETADVIVLAPHLTKVAELFRLGRTVRRRLRENIALSLGIKALVLVLAAAGLATLWIAVAADVGASLLVIANGMRLIGRGKEQAPGSEGT
ncbi:MAG: cation-translocating P-type ATPase [Planctomycetes bacterium]|nr:cation-translocating P-type ATPase [Planctomycetota bacterium]